MQDSEFKSRLAPKKSSEWHCDDGTYKGKGCVVVLHLFVVIVFFSMAGNEEVTLNWRHTELTTDGDYAHASVISREWISGLKILGNMRRKSKHGPLSFLPFVSTIFCSCSRTQ